MSEREESENEERRAIASAVCAADPSPTLPPPRACRQIAVPGQADALAAGQLVQHYKPGSIRDGDGPLMTFYLFFIIGFVATILQGLLSMHSLLENPFGTHPCKAR